MKATHKMYLPVIGIMFLLIIYFKECGKSDIPGKDYVEVEVVKYRYDSIPKTVFVPKPYPVPGKTIILTIPSHVDTNAILQQYFTSNEFKTEIRDTNIAATIISRVSKNNLDSMSFTYQWLQPITVIQPTLTEKKRIQLYLGGEIGGSKESFNASASLILKNKKDNLYSFRYGVVDKTYNVGTYFKIRLKNR